jgi:hypothetical protein
VDAAEQVAHRERATIFKAGAALREAFFGNSAAARESAKPALQLSNDREVEYDGDWRWLSVRYMPARTPRGLRSAPPLALRGKFGLEFRCRPSMTFEERGPRIERCYGDTCC